MEHARRSSGIYHEHLGSREHLPISQQHSHPYGAAGSSEALATSGAPFAGVAGEPVSMTGGDAPAAGTAPIPPARQKWYKTRKFIICQIITAILGIVLLFVLLFPVVKAIAQLVINRSTIQVDTASITTPTNGSFVLAMTGVIAHTGIINAVIHFTEPTTVDWVRPDGTRTQLGEMMFNDAISAKNKRATLNQTTTFNIKDEDAFAEFTATMITQPYFIWHLESNNVRVNAVKFPVAKGISFKKDLNLTGINNFNGNVQLQQFLLPRDAPEGGITFSATTLLNNPSPFNVDLGDTVFNLTYNNVYLGQGKSTNTKIQPGNNSITLDGTLVPHNNSPSDLAQLGNLFSSYLNGESSPVIATGVSTQQSNGQNIDWLSKGLQALQLNVPFKSPAPINPIQGIDIGFFNLSFTPGTAWAPVASTNEVHATMKLPFGFSVNISEIQNTFAINVNGSNVANLTTPIGASKSDIRVLSETDTEGTINITINNTPLTVPQDMHDAFSAFNQELTDAKSAQFRLEGFASAKAALPIGEITLSPINFNVSTQLLGLQGLQGDTTIKSVDVMGGTSDHIVLDIDLDIFNPSNLNLAVDDLQLQLFRDGGLLGTTLLPNLSLKMGNNSLKAVGSFKPNLDPQGADTLNSFVAGKAVPLQISGYSQSTNVSSLLQAFESLNVNATLPGLNTSLLKSASLTVLPTTGHGGNNVAHVQVTLANPFTGGIKITSVSSSVTSHGISLGTINQTTNFPAAGKSNAVSPNLDLNMNLDPSSVFTVLRTLAASAGMPTDQIDGIMQIGGYQLLPTTNADSRRKRHLHIKRGIFTGFQLPPFVDAAFSHLKSDVQLSSGVSIGDYPTQLQFTQASVPVKTDQSLHLLLPILAQPIVQKIVSASVLGIDTVLITDPAENSFGSTLKGSITNAGPFDAKISFGSGLTITWNGRPLGKIQMPDVDVVGDVGASINTQGTFQVADVGHLTDFTRTLLTEESFDWEITGENLTVNALGIAVSSITLPSKKITLKGMNGLKNGVVINTFDLPSNDPAGGIHLTLNTTVTNPSQVGVSLSTIGFQNFIGSTHLGPAASGPFVMAPQSTFNLPLVGRLIPQTSQDGLTTVSQVFTDFIHGKSSNVIVNGDIAGPSGVSWLNDAIKSLQISTVLPARGPLDVIKTISLDELTLMFTPDTAYAPLTSSKASTASFQLPFAFPLDVVALEQTITSSFNGQPFATLNIPKGPSKTDVQSRVIHLTFQNVPFSVHDDAHSTFQQFLTQTTSAKTETFALSGSANTDAQTAVGLLNIQGITFNNLPTSIAGLQNLNAKPAIVSNLDVNHGFPDFLLIKVDTELFNPSNLTIGTGDVSFGLQFNGQTIGVADLSNAIIVPGSKNYSTDVHYQPGGSAQAAGELLLENFIQGVVSDTTISGTSDTTAVDSLKPALAQIQLSASIPALHQNLITSTSIVLPPNIVQSGIAAATFSLSNPFTASINLLQVSTTATFQNITLGTIDVASASNPIHADGHSKITSPTLPLKFNLDPHAIIGLLSIRASQKHIDLGPLPALFQIALNNPDLGKDVKSSPDPNAPTCVSGKQFDVNAAILNALAGLEVDLAIKSTVKLDDFQTPLNFVQHNVPAVTDKTALFLIGAVANPVTQALVNQAQLTFSQANITNLTNEGFDLSLQGSLLNTGPLDALIEFTEPVTVAWQGRNIATISLPPVCAAANVGVPNYSTKGHLTITDQGAFTDFATFLLHNPEFEWDISTPALRVTALGNIFTGVSLSKSVSFKAFNNLPGVTIQNFDLPSDSPQGGITISTDSMIPSSAQLGIELGTVVFESFVQGVDLGPLSASNVFLAAQTTTKIHLDGRIMPQTGDALNTVGDVFSKFLAGQNQTLEVKGVSVSPGGQEVTWLSTAFKTLTLDVTLPGKTFTIIQSITIEDLELVMTTQDQAFAPSASSKNTLATYKNPFGFSLQVIESAQDITIIFNGANAAELNLPRAAANGGVSTGNVAPLQLSFQNQPLTALDHGAFEAFFAQTTDQQSAQTELKGTADVTAKTAVGNIPISGIPFDVKTSLAGINSFGHTADLTNVKLTGSGGAGGSEFIVSPVTVGLNNPSNISLSTVDIALPVFYKGVQIGRSVVDTFNLVPGGNTFDTAEFHYEPANANDTTAQDFLTQFIQSTDNIPLSIKGDAQSSPFASLVPALEGTSLETSVKGSGAVLVTHIHVDILITTFIDNLVDINFDVQNPFDSDLTIEFVQSDAGLNGEIFAHFEQAFENFVIPAHGTANSGTIPNVLLTQGVVASLAIVPDMKLDIFNAQTVLVGNNAGYRIPWLQLQQQGVPTDYAIAV